MTAAARGRDPTFHTLTVARRRAADRRRRRGHLRRARRPAPTTFDFDAGQSLTLRRIDRRRRAPPHLLDLRAGRRRAADRRARDPGRAVLAWLVHEVRARRRGRGADAERQLPRRPGEPAGRHLCIAAGSGITPMLSIATHRAGQPGARRDPALRQPHHRLGDVRRGARPTSRTATAPASSSCTCSPASPATSSCSPAGSTPTGCAGC